jgi:CRP-like cAMP-binding protein
MANTSRQTLDIALFQRLIPLKDLDRGILEKLSGLAKVEQHPAGEFLFERGDTRTRTYYLLAGEIELCSPLFPTHKVTAGSDAGRYPLAHSFPRQFTAVTVTEAEVLILPLDVSEVMNREHAAAKAAPEPQLWEKRWLESPLLRRLSPEHKQSLLACMEEIAVRAGQVVIHQDQPADSYYVIKKGRCRVSRKPSPSAPEIRLAELAEGQGFGEEALITGVPRNASVTMLSDGVLLRLGKEAFIAQMARPLLHHLPFQHAIRLVEQGAVLVDVRSPEEFESDSLIGSINMPLPVLRLKAGRLNRDRTYIVYSNAGQTSSVAVFLMLQQGLNACVLEGGLGSAPRERVKHTGLSDVGPEANVLSFPGARAEAGPVDWNNVSDDVLWRTTLGYRQDAGVEAALGGRPPQGTAGDGTLQGFDDIRLFTTIDTLQDIRLQPQEDPPSRGPGLISSAGTGIHRPRHLPPQWQTRSARGGAARRIAMGVLLGLALAGAGFGGYLYLTGGQLPDKLQAASPVILEEQRKLDDKLNRLLDAIDTLPMRQTHSKEAEAPSQAAAGEVVRRPQAVH